MESVLTDGVPGPGRFRGDGEWAESESVLSSDPEQVVLTFKQSRHHIGLAGTGCIHLITNQLNPQLINHNKKLGISFNRSQTFCKVILSFDEARLTFFPASGLCAKLG